MADCVGGMTTLLAAAGYLAAEPGSDRFTLYELRP
jgi:hypothetical protein